MTVRVAAGALRVGIAQPVNELVGLEHVGRAHVEHLDRRQTMSPNYVQIGMRLSGYGGATSGNASFTSNCYFLGGICNDQSDPGSPPGGYVSQPPYGYWYSQPSSSQTGGVLGSLQYHLYTMFLNADCAGGPCFLGYAYPQQIMEVKLKLPLQPV